MRKSFATIVVLLTPAVVFGQTFDTEFYPAPEWDEDGWSVAADGGSWNGGEEMWNREEVFAPEIDPGVFSVPAWNAPDPFRDFSRYRFGTVRYRERGLDSRHFKVLLGGVDLSDNLSSYPDYALITLARRGGLAREHIPAMVATSHPASVARSEKYSLRPSGDGLYVLLRGSDRYSRLGADIRHSRKGEKGWSHTVAATGQWGDDGHIAGVYTDEAGAVAALDKQWKSGASLTLFAAGGLSERGGRSAATQEAFTLTGDDLYNPNWGMQGGRVRNSRTTGTEYFFGAAAFETPLGKERTLSLTAAFRHNRYGRTRLSWYDAPSPQPDYYRSMPSFFPEWDASDIIADAWRRGDESVTQIDWNELYYNNTLAADGQATYIVEEQVELSRDVHLNLSIDRRVNRELEVSYGVRLRRDEARYFKVADDMLGGEWVPNVDQYVTDPAEVDGEYHTSPPNENDLRHPGRQVRLGERFGYDYSITRLRPEIYGTVRWNRTNYGLTLSGTLAHTRLQREGFYEKELFPGGASFGRSGVKAFTTWSVGAAGWWNVSPRHGLSLSAFAGTESPFPREMFLSPEQNNFVAPGTVPSGLYGAEVSWVFTGEIVDLRVGGFVNATTGGSQIRQYYDDLSSTFADMALSGVDRLNYGLEAGVGARLARWLTFSAGGSVGEYRYNSEPVATVYADSNGEIISEGVVCYLSGLATGPPQMVAAAELAYSDRKYLRFALSCEWMGGRFVEINPLYHSSRVAGINSSPEIMSLFTSQERLPDAFTLGASASKGFVVGRGYLRIGVSVRNLLSSRIIHSAYEQMRIRRLGSGLDRTLVPFPSKYTYSWPLTWSITVSYSL